MTADPRALAVALAVAGLVVAIGAVVIANDTPASSSASSAPVPSPRPGVPVRVPEESPPLAEQVARDGTVVVGKHVKRGTYRTAGGPRCTWARLVDLAGEPFSVLDRGRAPHRTTVDLELGVVGFQTNGCPGWVMVR